MAEKNKNIESLMRVTSFKSWTTLWMLGGVLAAVIVWSIIGELPERIEGKGMMQTLAGTQQIAAAGEGIIGRLLVKEGDNVTDGTPVAEVKSGRVDAEYRAAVARVVEAERNHELNSASARSNIAAVQVQITNKRAELRQRQAERDLQRKNFDARIVPKDVLDAAERAVNQVNTELSGLDIRVRSYNDSIAQSASNVARAKIDLRRNEATLTEVKQVNSAVVGRVTRILRRPGDTVYQGQPIAEVESAAGGTALEVVAYIAASNGRRVMPKQSVRLALNGVPTAEFGYLLGEVTSVSQYPVTTAVAQRVLKEDAVSEASYEVKIRPLKVTESQTRYLWTGAGNNEKVLSGTPVTVSVQVAARTPYTLVIPRGKEDRVPVAKRPSTVLSGSN